MTGAAAQRSWRPPPEHLGALGADYRTMAHLARGALATPIEHCPPWTMWDLLSHTGRGHRWVEGHLRCFATGGDPATVVVEPPPPGDAIVDWFERGGELLVEALAELDPDDSVGTAMWNARLGSYFGSPSLHRHQAKETAVHRWDAELATGYPEPFDDPLAADWLDDTLAYWLPAAAAARRQAQGWDGEGVRFHSTSPECDWVVRVDRCGEVTVQRSAGVADVSVAGRSSDLLLLAMNRIGPPSPDLEVAGAVALVDRWAATIRYGTAVGSGGR